MRGTLTNDRALRSVAVQFWVNGVVFASFIPRLPELRLRLGIDLPTVGLLLTLGSLGGLASGTVCGRLIERYGTRTIMTAGALGLVATLPVIGFATGPGLFLAALATMHASDVLTDVAMNMQGSWLSARRTTPVINRLHGLWSLGTVVGGVAATAAASVLSLRTHLVIVAAILAVALTYVAPGLLADDERPPERARAGSTIGRGLPLTLLFGSLAVMATAIEMVPTDWAAFRLVEDLDLSPGTAGLGFVAMTTGMVIGRFGGDLATSKLGRRHLTQLAAATSGLGLAAATLAPSAPLSIVGFAVAGLGAAVVFPGLYDLAARAPGRPGALLGTMTASIRIGALALPITVGTLAGSGSVTVGVAMALVTIPAAIGLFFLSPRAG